ncbi:methylenetetrahydrofolate reductase [Aphanomyces astaci]|uniref:Methylenetetrahydrofolate reductase n=1 Tax=Aphanomyces astaci TaxID=112090 RepID=W4GLI5_APHAT|nr:methylenetetrahydrofolate reductase [Aphanomyces astaci]ETV80540.1 methylenetetrahydrofolate reductase [Aphanomyces astaci]|eukprot:XP_009830464.1 methylenetetrahydrofolate reductase [Aphanomyces astaci]
MGKIIDRLTELEKTGSPSVSFEFFPAKTEDGVFNLLNRVEEMGFQLQPTFVTLTWRSAFKDEKLWLKIGSHIQNEFKIDVLMHLTCHLPREQLREILKNVRAAGIRNILALRGDPPIGSERWKAIPGGFQNAVELIRFIREEHGDWFCIAAAGYAEVHTEAWNNPNLPPSDQVRRVDMLRLKEKQDAGADFIITQFFFDVDKLLQWIRDCRQVGITIPILPGYLPIQTYNSFLKFTNWCKTSVPPQVEDALVTIKNDDSAVKKYGIQLAVDTCRKLLANNLSLHFYTMNLATTVRTVLEGLHLIERERGLPWGAPITRSKDGTLEKSIEQVRPIFWSNRASSYIARTSEWDDFPNGRWGDRTSPAYGELSEYYLAYKRPKVARDALWGRPQTEQDVWNVFVKFIEGSVKQLPWCEQGLSGESTIIRENLRWINSMGFLTINSQPRINGAPSEDPSVGWGGKDGFVFQKAYVEFFVPPHLMQRLVVALADYPNLSYHAFSANGTEYTNSPGPSVTAVTWGVFPGKEIIQPTVVDTASFAAWKDEAFELWLSQWASAYETDSPSHQLIKRIFDSYVLVNVVDNDYTNEDSDIFKIFARVITESMTKDDLRQRVLELEGKNEKLHETVAKLKIIQAEANRELKDLHGDLSTSREENSRLKAQVRELRSRLAMAEL